MTGATTVPQPARANGIQAQPFPLSTLGWRRQGYTHGTAVLTRAVLSVLGVDPISTKSVGSDEGATREDKERMGRGQDLGIVESIPTGAVVGYTRGDVNPTKSIRTGRLLAGAVALLTELIRLWHPQSTLIYGGESPGAPLCWSPQARLELDWYRQLILAAEERMSPHLSRETMGSTED